MTSPEERREAQVAFIKRRWAGVFVADDDGTHMAHGMLNDVLAYFDEDEPVVADAIRYGLSPVMRLALAAATLMTHSASTTPKATRSDDRAALIRRRITGTAPCSWIRQRPRSRRTPPHDAWRAVPRRAGVPRPQPIQGIAAVHLVTAQAITEQPAAHLAAAPLYDDRTRPEGLAEEARPACSPGRMAGPDLDLRPGHGMADREGRGRRARKNGAG